MFMNILNLILYFLSGIFLNMSWVHLFNFAETQNHPMIKKSKYPRLASTLWGLFQLLCGALILLGLNYQFNWSLNTLFLFLGFSLWAILLGVVGERRDRKAKHD